MPMTATPVRVHGTPTVPPAGLSPETLKLWLAAQRYRRLADIAAEKAAQ